MKIIKDFKINLSDMSAAKQTRNFTITGDENAIFSLEITNEDATPTYYNFDTKTVNDNSLKVEYFSNDWIRLSLSTVCPVALSI